MAGFGAERRTRQGEGAMVWFGGLGWEGIGMDSPGQARRSRIGRFGVARRGMAVMDGTGGARPGLVWTGGRGRAWRGFSRSGTAWRSWHRHEADRRGLAGSGLEWPSWTDMARIGEARHGVVGPVVAWLERAWPGGLGLVRTGSAWTGREWQA